MIMYITLVFMAVKYTLVYLKRFLTLAVLTLMAPGLGVSYAMQKALSGKSSSLKSWFSEYLLNLLIQVVHALIYAIFISSALVFSLKNISGIIIALILMNFSLNAEKMFRKIFNLDPGNKGLLGATETAGDKEKIQKDLKTIKGLAIGAKPVTNALMFPGKLVAGTAFNIAQAATPRVVAGISNIARDIKNNQDVDDIDNGTRPKTREKSENIDETAANPAPQEQTQGAEQGERRTSSQTKIRVNEDKELIAKGEDVLRQELIQAEEEYKKSPNDEKKRIAVLDKNRRLKRYREVLGGDLYGIKTKDVVVGHIKGAFDIDNYFDFKFDENGNIIKTVPKKGLGFGTLQYNSAKGKFEVNKDNRVISNFGASKLLGFTDEDKKIFKEQVMMPSLQSLGGMVSMFVGMGNLVAHPLEGMTAMTVGYNATSNMLRKFKKPKKGAPGRFKFNRFTTPTIKHISDNVVRQANRELSASLNKNIKLRHPSLWQNIKNGRVVAKTIVPAAIGVTGIAFGAPALGGATALLFRRSATHVLNVKDQFTKKETKKETRKGSKRQYKNIYDPYGIDEEFSKLNIYPTGATTYDAIDIHHYKQIKDQMKEFQDDASTLISESEIKDATIAVEKNNTKIDKALDKELQNQILVQYWLTRGFEYDVRTGRTTRIQEVQESDIKQGIKVKHKITDEAGKVHIKEEKITQSDIKKIDKRIDEVIASKINGEELDVSSEQVMDEIVKDLSLKLQKDGILRKNQSAVKVFAKEGRLQTLIKDKAETANSIVRTEIAQKLKLDSKELNAVEQAVTEVAKESADSDGNVDLARIDQENVLAKVQEKLRVQGPTSEESQNRNERDVISTLDRLDQHASEERYKAAIGSILSEKANSTDNLVININSQENLNNILLSQTGVDILQIRDRISTSDRALSRSITSEIAPQVDTTDEVKKTKKDRKKEISKIIDRFSQTEVVVTDDQGKVKKNDQGKPIKKVMTTEEKLAQANAALSLLGLEDNSQAKATALESLLAISNMQDNLEGLNLHSERTLSSNSKFRKKPKKSYMTAIRELSDVKQEQYMAQIEEIRSTEADKPNAKQKIEELAKKVKKAEKKMAIAGPVQDINAATKDVLKAIKQEN